MKSTASLLISAALIGFMSSADAQTAPSGGATVTGSSSTPAGTVGTAATGTGAAVPVFDGASGAALATGANQINGAAKTGIVAGTAQIGHTANPIGTAGVFSGAATITTAGTYQLLHTATAGMNGCHIVNPSTNPSGTTLTVEWTGKTGTSPDAFTTTLPLGASTDCEFVPVAGGTIAITGSATGAQIAGGVW